MRPIDADELLKDPYFLDESIPERVIFAEAVKDAPTIDAVPVVRCFECKHHKDTVCHWCNKLKRACPNNSDFFCSYGERKEGEHDQG